VYSSGGVILIDATVYSSGGVILIDATVYSSGGGDPDRPLPPSNGTFCKSHHESFPKCAHGKQVRAHGSDNLMRHTWMPFFTHMKLHCFWRIFHICFGNLVLVVAAFKCTSATCADGVHYINNNNNYVYHYVCVIMHPFRPFHRFNDAQFLQVA
jgi:hypothetical protein